MRTTLTLDPDVAGRLRQETASGKHSFKQVINDRLRAGLGIIPRKKQKPFRVAAHSSPYHPGVDPAKLNQLLDEMDAENFRSTKRKA